MTIFSALLLAAVISIDTLVLAFAYGAAQVKVRLSRIIIINLISTTLFGLSLLLGLHVGSYISPEVTKWVSFGILAAVGICKLVGGLLRKRGGHSLREIRLGEAIALGAVLSIDGDAVGLGVSLYNTSLASCIAAISFTFAISFAFMVSGLALGGKIIRKKRSDLSWLSGTALIVLGVLRLF